MGLFDSLKKSLQDLSNEVEKHKDDIQKGLDMLSNQGSQSARSNDSASSAQYASRTPDQSSCADDNSVYPGPVTTAHVDRFNDFDDIIVRNFPDHEVRRNVPASELKPGCHPACTPVQFMFYSGGEPVLAVVLVRTNNYGGMNVKATKKICEDLGIKYIRFYHEYENAESYVVERIKNNL